MKLLGNISKWSWAEMTSNNNGKTSSTATSGFFCIVIGLLVFVISALAKWDITYVYASITVITLGSGLLGYNKKVSSDMAKLDASTTNDVISDAIDAVKDASTQDNSNS